MYQIKSGQEIVEQLFSLQDRGGRDLAIRPEITPTLARMVNQQINSLPRPIKWFSVPRLCRAERPQKGRLREFFQWNIDIIGEDRADADAEIIFTTLDYLRMVGLTAKDIRAKISSRRLLAAVLTSIGIPAEKLEPIYAVLDKKAKLPPEAFEEMLAEQVPDKDQAEEDPRLHGPRLRGGVAGIVGAEREALDQGDRRASGRPRRPQGDGCQPSSARSTRASCGAWRTTRASCSRCTTSRASCGPSAAADATTTCCGTSAGPPYRATGMGMGDCVLEILLEQRGLLDTQVPKRGLEYFVALLSRSAVSPRQCTEVTARIRSKGHSANFSYKQGGLSKQLKEAAGQNAEKCVIIGQEYKDQRQVVVKDMATGEQQLWISSWPVSWTAA